MIFEMPGSTGNPMTLSTEKERTMAKTISTLIGIVFILVGIVGFFSHELMGAHLSTAHNVIHLVSGAIALYFGMKGTPAQAKTFALIFGFVYGALGVVGFLAGEGEDRMLRLLPGTLELGTVDHIIHIAIGALFLIGALATRTSAARVEA
jgi:hypothetical protein